MCFGLLGLGRLGIDMVVLAGFWWDLFWGGLSGSMGVGVDRSCDPTHDDEAVMNGAPGVISN
jgi:hypothetical protein